MSIKPIPQVITPKISERFNEHIRDNFNQRILFSAPFGSGKSTFLRQYFDDNEDFVVLKLFPVNYSIAQNEDVFELIKYDLLYELLSKYPKEIEIEQEQYSQLLISQMFLLHQMKIDLPIKLLMKAASAVKGTDEPEKDVIEGISKVIEDFSDYKSKINSTEWDQLFKYIKTFKSKKGNVHESDFITELIIKMLDQIQAKKNSDRDIENKVTTVLLIDDLDRLDPEHVFRLFNIFSAHYDDVTESNKFGFDKIIFVCDINNIQQMFNHRYGINVEFNGYIDKFYSSQIFLFDITQYLKESIKKLIMARYDLLRFYPKELSISNSFKETFSLDKQEGFYSIIAYVINGLIDIHQIKIRNFYHFKNYSIPNFTFTYSKSSNHVVYYPILVLIYNLELFFGRPKELELALEKLYQNYASDYRISTINGMPNRSVYNEMLYNLMSFSLPFILDSKQVFGVTHDGNSQYTFQVKNEHGQEIYIVYKIGTEISHSYNWVKYERTTLSGILTNGINTNPEVINPNPFWFLYIAYKNIKINMIPY